MRYTTLLPLAATASALIIPDDATLQNLVLEEKTNVEDAAHSWWHAIPSADDIRTSVNDILTGAVDTVERQASRLHDFIPEVEFDLFGNGDNDDEDEEGGGDHDHPGRRPHHPPHKGHRGGHGRHGHHGPSNYTIYEAIQYSNYTKKLAKLVDEFPDIVKALNSTKANYTLFAPIDRAFEKIPEHHKKPSKEFLEKLLEYHVVPGYFPAGRVLAGHTLPTLVKEDSLGGKHQRLRVHLSLFGLRINFYSKIIVPNMFFKNGVVHGIDSILVPPPPAEKIVSLLPGEFSTLLLAAEKTGLRRDKENKEHATTGLTVFAPTNNAFRRLGPGANAFLFNTERGLKYLKALLKYHIVVNETLYSDAYYGRKKDSEDDIASTDGGNGNGHFHVDLPTLLGDKSLSIDIARWYGIITIKINGFTRVAVQDGIAKDGVIHALASVLIPPHETQGFWPEGVEIGVEDLVERLEAYVDEDRDDEEEGVEWFGEL